MSTHKDKRQSKPENNFKRLSLKVELRMRVNNNNYYYIHPLYFFPHSIVNQSLKSFQYLLYS